MDRRHQLAVEIAQARERAQSTDGWTGTKEARLALLETTVTTLHADLERLMAALEGMGER